MNWYFVCWSLLVPEPLLKGIIQYIEENEVPETWDDVPHSLVGEGLNHIIDLPGMCSANRTIYEIEVAGLTVGIPATDFSAIFRELMNLQTQHHGGLPHYGLYGSIRGLLLTPPQREEMLKEMGKQLARAIEVGDWENRQLNAAFAGTGGVTTATVEIEGKQYVGEVFEEPLKSGVVVAPRPVIDRDIEEA